jgi:excisionase family DNA binding protein
MPHQAPPITPVYASVKDICARYNCSRSHVYTLLGDGKIIARKNGPRILVDVTSVDAHFASLPLAEIKRDKYRSKLPASPVEAA